MWPRRLAFEVRCVAAIKHTTLFNVHILGYFDGRLRSWSAEGSWPEAETNSADGQGSSAELVETVQANGDTSDDAIESFG